MLPASIVTAPALMEVATLPAVVVTSPVSAGNMVVVIVASVQFTLVPSVVHSLPFVSVPMLPYVPGAIELMLIQFVPLQYCMM